MATPYDGKCPNCGHEISLAELKRMAIGDGWERYLQVVLPTGKRMSVSFSDYNPATMRIVTNCQAEAEAPLGAFAPTVICASVSPSTYSIA